jgi:quercetin dioxygenase-like cupin family protein
MNRILALALIAITAGGFLHAHRSHVSQTMMEAQKNSISPRPLILQEDEGDPLVHNSGPLSGLPFTIKVDSEYGNAQDFFVFTEILAPGQTIPFHKHDNAEELLMCEEGGATFIVGDKRAVAGPRSIVFIPRDTWISGTNTSSKDIHMTAIFSRPGFEKYMRAIGTKPGQPIIAVPREQLAGLRAMGHAMYWDTSKGPYPPGVAHP